LILYFMNDEHTLERIAMQSPIVGEGPIPAPYLLVERDDDFVPRSSIATPEEPVPEKKPYVQSSEYFLG